MNIKNFQPRCGTVAMLAVTLLVSGCGGRVARPVAATTPIDDKLNCNQVKAELRINQARISELGQEITTSHNNNTARLATAPISLANPLFIDVSHSEQKEINALNQRDAVLDTLIAQKCPQS